jgi:hypothetical protein
MKSGDKFLHCPSGIIYTLQKLPDFDRWMLIVDHPDHKRCCFWMWPEHESGPLGAFGGYRNKFTSCD